MFQFHHTVRLSDTDVTKQVYYARPLEWLEWCRVSWFDKHFGNFLNFVEKEGVTFFPSKVLTDYKKPILFGDHLIIEMRVNEIKKVSFIFDYTVMRGADVVLKSAITMVCFDLKKQSLRRLHPALLQQLQRLQ
ncbi:acyl-CoA thioesterase [bacterium]|nr:acyl-CoA thioesterase [bacterium]